MKNTSVIIISVSALLVGAALGFSVTIRKGFLNRDDYIRLSHVDLQHRAQVYFRLLQAGDSGRPEDMATL